MEPLPPACKPSPAVPRAPASPSHPPGAPAAIGKRGHRPGSLDCRRGGYGHAHVGGGDRRYQRLAPRLVREPVVAGNAAPPALQAARTTDSLRREGGGSRGCDAAPPCSRRSLDALDVPRDSLVSSHANSAGFASMPIGNGLRSRRGFTPGANAGVSRGSDVARPTGTSCSRRWIHSRGASGVQGAAAQCRTHRQRAEREPNSLRRVRGGSGGSDAGPPSSR